MTRGLRRGGTLARRVLIGRRRGVAAEALPLMPAGRRASFGLRNSRLASAPAGSVLAPVQMRVSDEIVTVEAPPLLTGVRTPARMLRFLVVQACTAASLLLGMLAIFLAFHGEIRWAAVSLLACVIFDGLDGAFARKFGVSTPFGGQMDSLADMCSFGIATPVVAFTWLSGSVDVVAVAPACALVAVCAAVRLARFNVSPKNGLYFCGVPTTMAAAIIVASVLVGPHVDSAILVLGVGVLALSMVSTFPYMKIGQILRVPPLVWVLLAVVIWIDPFAAFSLVIGGYLISGPLLWVKQHLAVSA